jgi:hypothetical protein
LPLCTLNFLSPFSSFAEVVFSVSFMCRSSFALWFVFQFAFGGNGKDCCFSAVS